MDKKKGIKKEEELGLRKRKYEHDIDVDDDDVCRLSLYLPYDRPIPKPERMSRPRIQQQQQQPSSFPPSPPLDVLPSHDTTLAGQILFPIEWLVPSQPLQKGCNENENNLKEDENVNEDDICFLSLSHGPNTMPRRLSHRIQQQSSFPPSPPLRVSPSHTPTLPQLLLLQSPDLLQTSKGHGYSNNVQQQQQSSFPPLEVSSSLNTILGGPIFFQSPELLAPPPTLQTSGVYGYVNNEQLKAPPARRVRRNPKKLETESIPPPYPWAKDQRATIHTLTHLLSRNITTVSGEVECKRCEKTFQLQFNIRKKFSEIAIFIIRNKEEMRDRAPVAWLNPSLATCKFCNAENSAKPVLGDDSKTLNWLFLLLGGMLGCCTLEQLKYFCKYTRVHRTGAKDRVLYLAYLDLCKQLDPNGPFDHDH